VDPDRRGREKKKENRKEIWVLGFGLGKEEREREKRDGEKKKQKTKEKVKPVATGILSPSNGPNLLEFFKNIQRLKSLGGTVPPFTVDGT
jgi:hypothetical protein